MSSEEKVTVIKSKKEKKEKKSRKRKSEEDAESGTSSNSSKKLTKEERKESKLRKKAEKDAALANVPKVDEHGITYTKIQIKRMVKRVKRGLPPVPTEQEERERIRRLRLEQKETEDELAGMIYKSKDDEDEEIDGDVDNEDFDKEDDENIEGNETEKGDVEDEQKMAEDVNMNEAESNERKPQCKKARTKVVPSDYMCFACKNRNTPLHWIYDCPDKIRQPGTNKVKKKLRGVNYPSSRKVFVSGLPFEVKGKEVEAYFEKETKCGKVVHCKLLLFEDTKRCKGNGFVTFDTDEGAKKALKLNGTIFPSIEDADKKGADKPRKQLKLAVRKVLDRTKTRKN